MTVNVIRIMKLPILLFGLIINGVVWTLIMTLMILMKLHSWVAYWNSTETLGNAFDESEYSLWVKLENEALFTPESFQVCFHPWSYYSVEEGDGFATAFDKSKNTDYFRLHMYGVKEDGTFISTPVTYPFADYTLTPKVFPETGWVTIKSFPGLENIKYLVFQMDTSDKSEYGGIEYLNTAT
ncbi:MAG: DUF4465 domain-containing protein [Tannerellaceae bacterium]|nr:DUF4465 domain-containing protein [Tannerellaceae bacterium]